MKYIFPFLTGLVLVFSGMIHNVFADDPKARKIMEKVEARNDGDNMTSDMEMVLIDKNKKKRIRKIRSFSKDKGEDTLRLMFFQHPSNIKNTGFLTIDYDDPIKDDDQWLYLPALKKTKRIASSDKSSSFMGSDLNYADMTSRNLEDYDFTIIKEDDVKGTKVWLIQSIPRSKKVIHETGYKESLLFVQKENYIVIRAVHFVDEGGYLKYMNVKHLDQIDGIWIATEIHMTKKRRKKPLHKTIMKFNNVKFNQNLSDDLFTIRRLEKGL